MDTWQEDEEVGRTAALPLALVLDQSQAFGAKGPDIQVDVTDLHLLLHLLLRMSYNIIVSMIPEYLPKRV